MVLPGPGGLAVLEEASVKGRVRVRLLIRPERVEPGDGGANTLPARVTSAMFLGDHSEVRLELPGGVRVLASVRGAAVFEPGERLTVTLPPDAFLEAP